MANKKLTDLTELTTPADGDFLYIVDVSDTTESAQGTSKKIRKDKVDSGASKENIANKQNSLAIDGTGTKYPTVDAVNAVLPINYSKIVYVNATSPITATIFDTENPPVTNDNLLKNDVANLYIGTDASTWVYNSTTYVTKTVTATSSNFYLAGTTTDAGNTKTGHITRSGAVTLTGPLNILNLKISSTPVTSVGSPDILTRNPSTTALEKKLVSDFLQTTGSQNFTGSKTGISTDGTPTTLALTNSNTTTGYAVASFTNSSTSSISGSSALLLNNDNTGSDASAIQVRNNSTGLGFFIKNLSSGIGTFFENWSTGVGFQYNSRTGSTGDLIRFTKNASTTTSINHLGEINTMTPTVSTQVATKGYTDAKITQTITNGVTDKSPSEDAVYDAFQNYSKIILKNTTTSTPVTLTLSQTILYSDVILANSFKNGDFFNVILSRVGKIGTAGSLTQTVRINTTNTLAGATIIASNTGSTASLNHIIGRRFSLESGFLNGFAGGSAPSDMVNSSASITPYAFDPTVDNYIFVVGQLSNAGDSMFHSSFILTN